MALTSKTTINLSRMLNVKCYKFLFIICLMAGFFVKLCYCITDGRVSKRKTNAWSG